MLVLCSVGRLVFQNGSLYILKRKLGTKTISASHARYVEIQGIPCELSLHKELPPGWVNLQFLSCGHLEGQLWHNHHVLSEKLDNEERICLCWALEKQISRWRFICKWFIKEIIPEPSSKEIGKATVKGEVGFHVKFSDSFSLILKKNSEV